MAADPTEAARREMLSTGQPVADLEATEGPTWTTETLSQEFEVLGFMAPFVVVRRKSDGVKGSLEFTHQPRQYFNWSAASIQRFVIIGGNPVDGIEVFGPFEEMEDAHGWAEANLEEWWCTLIRQPKQTSAK